MLETRVNKRRQGRSVAGTKRASINTHLATTDGPDTRVMAACYGGRPNMDVGVEVKTHQDGKGFEKCAQSV